MRRLHARYFAFLAGCSRTDEQPAVDAPDLPEPEVVSFAGDWTVQALPMEGDSIVVGITITATDTPDGWSTMFAHLEEPVSANSVVIAGDSATVMNGPYPSALREGAMVSMTTVLYVFGDELTGHFTATYDQGKPTMFEGRLVGTRSE